MATSGNQIRQTFEAGADLSAKKDTFVVVTNAAERTINTPAAGAKVDGVLLNDPRAAGHAGPCSQCGNSWPPGGHHSTGPDCGRSHIGRGRFPDIKQGAATAEQLARIFLTFFWRCLRFLDHKGVS